MSKQVTSINYGEKIFTKEWQESFKVYPLDEEEGFFYFMISNNFLNVDEYLKRKKGDYSYNKETLVENLKNLQENKQTEVNYMDMLISIKEYEEFVNVDIDKIKRQIDFAESVRGKIKINYIKV